MSEKYRRKSINKRKLLIEVNNSERVLNSHQVYNKKKNFLLDYVFKTKNENFITKHNNSKIIENIEEPKKTNVEILNSQIFSPINSKLKYFTERTKQKNLTKTIFTNENSKNLNLNHQFNDMAKKIKSIRNKNSKRSPNIINDINVLSKNCLTEDNEKYKNNLIISQNNTGNIINTNYTNTSSNKSLKIIMPELIIGKNKYQNDSFRISYSNPKNKMISPKINTSLNKINNNCISKDNINLYEVNIGKYLQFNKNNLVKYEMNRTNKTNYKIFNINNSSEYTNNKNNLSNKNNISLKNSFSHLINSTILNVENPEELHFASVMFFTNKKKISQNFDNQCPFKKYSSENSSYNSEDYSENVINFDSEIDFETES